MRGLLRIGVHDVSWIEHIETGQRVETASYDMGPAEEWSASPLTPADFAVTTASDSEQNDPTAGMFRLGSELFPRFVPNHAPRTLLVPYHGRSRYEVFNELRGEALTVKNLEALVGQPVVVNASNMGTIVDVKPDRIVEFHWSPDSYGAGEYLLSKLESVGLLRFKGGRAKSVDKPKYSGELAHHGSRIEVLIAEGKCVELRIHRRQDTLFLENKTEALRVLVAGTLGVRSAPIAERIGAEERATGRWGNVIHTIAGGIIDSVEFLRSEPGEIPDLDSMSDEQVVRFFEKPTWPTLDFRICTFDEGWVQHLRPGTVFETTLPRMREEDPWDGPPLRWPEP
jgi:hypothetical protein